MQTKDKVACRVCATLYDTELEAVLCTPAALIPTRYPGTVVPT